MERMEAMEGMEGEEDGDDEVYYACQLDVTPFRATKLRKPGKELLSKEKRVQLQKMNLKGMMEHRQGEVEVRTFNGYAVCGGVPFCYRQTRECVSGVEMGVEELKVHLREAHGLKVGRVVDIEGEWEAQERMKAEMEMETETEERME